jgi:hypothetical protein
LHHDAGDAVVRTVIRTVEDDAEAHRTGSADRTRVGHRAGAACDGDADAAETAAADRAPLLLFTVPPPARYTPCP